MTSPRRARARTRAATALGAVGMTLVISGCGGDTDQESEPASSAAESSSATATADPAPSSESTGADPSRSTGNSSAPLELTSPTGALGRCAPPTAESLRGSAEYAFEGEVTDVTEDRVSMRVDRWYRGEGASTVSVTAPPPGLRAILQSAEFTVGERFLVAANEERDVLVCGLTVPKTPRTTTLYRQAFPQ